jgi:acyl carrier protein
MPVEDIGLNRALSDLGMDSLMTFELYVAAERALKIQLPMVSLADGTSINDIAEDVLVKLRSGHDDEVQTAQAAMLSKHVADDVDARALDELTQQVMERERALGPTV